MEKACTGVLAVLLLAFGALNVIGVQPGEDNNRWLLYLFLLAWPALSVLALVVGILAFRVRTCSASVAIAGASLSLIGFAMWGHAYAGLW